MYFQLFFFYGFSSMKNNNIITFMKNKPNFINIVSIFFLLVVTPNIMGLILYFKSNLYILKIS